MKGKECILRQDCKARERVDVDATCKLCDDYLILDPNDKKKCIPPTTTAT